jgi:hypothetical protein
MKRLEKMKSDTNGFDKTRKRYKDTIALMWVLLIISRLTDSNELLQSGIRTSLPYLRYRL